MAKPLDLSDSASILRDEVQKYAQMLKSFIDRSAVMRAYQIRRRSERLYAYHGILRDACCACFKGSNVSIDGKKCTVWGYNGKVWNVVPHVVFADAVGEALIGAASQGDFVVKGDWVEKKSVLLQSAYAGVSSSSLDRNPAIVGFRNGVWDFTDVYNPVYHSFDERMPVTELLPYDYDAEAECPMWRSFLSMMLRPADIPRLQKYLGLGVVCRRTLPQVIEDTLWLVGSGANGKTTIENVVRDVYGYNNISECSMAELLDRNQISRMLTMASVEGRIFNICSEVDMDDISKGSDAFKRLCSGEPQNARGIGRDVHRVYDIPFMVFSMNQRPSNRRMDAAFRRRIVEIRFNTTVREKDMDAALGSKLRSELSGIRNWMIEGYKLLEKDGFMFDHSNDEDYMEANGQFFDIFTRKEGIRPSAWAGYAEVPQLVTSSALYDRFAEFCERNMYGTEAPSKKSMGQDLRRLSYAIVRKASGIYYEVYCERKLDYATT